MPKLFTGSTFRKKSRLIPTIGLAQQRSYLKEAGFLTLRAASGMPGSKISIHDCRGAGRVYSTFEDDVDAVYIVWNYEVIREMKRLGCRLLHAKSDNPLLGKNAFVRAFKRFLMLFPAYRYAGSTCLMVFER